MVIYLDSVILVYYFDYAGPFNIRATGRLAAAAAAGDSVAVSDLVRLECRVKHIRTGDAARLAVFDSYFAKADVQLIPFTTAVFDQATLIRATHHFKLGDSLHLAAAVVGGCDRFLTNDGRLSTFKGVPVEVLP